MVASNKDGKKIVQGHISPAAHRSMRMFAVSNDVNHEKVIEIALLEMERVHNRGGAWSLPQFDDDTDDTPVVKPPKTRARATAPGE